MTTAGISAAGTGTGIGTTAATIVADAGGSIDLATTPRNIGLTFTPTSFTGDTAHPALYVAQGSLSLGGNAFTVNNASGTPLGAGTYRLIQQASGSVASAGGYVVVVTGSGLVQYGVASISVSGGNVDMVVTVYIPKDLVWQGGNPDSTWNLNTTSNFLDGASAAAFNTTDKVLFNSVGSSYNAVNLSGTLAPGSVTVDAANDYTFSGGGLIGGTTKLIKTGTGTLDLQVVNSYTGGTIVSNGMVRLGVNNAIPGTGSGNVEVYTPGVINLNSLADTINGLYGDGTVDNTSGADATLTLGNNNSGGTFTGLLRNTAGTLSVTKNGNGLQVIEGAHTYSGATTINAGSLRVNNPNAIGSGASALTINAGSLLISSDLILASLAGAGGTLANASGNTTTNRITLSGAGAFSGIISDGAGGAIRLYVPSGAAPRFNGVCTYSGGTIVASGATLEVGAISAPVNQSGAAGTGGILASNNSTISVPTSLATAGNIGNSITFATPGSTVTFSGASQGNSINGQVNGAANDTNILMGPFSLGGAMQYSNFLGTVVLSNGASIRWFVGNAGGENTTFDMQNAFMFSRDPNTMRLGALKGTGSIPNPSFSGAGFGHAIWHIGAKGIDSTYAGTFSGSNSLVKVGAGRLTFSGCVTVTNALEGEGGYTNYLYSPAIVYGGSTTISNGVLALTAPNDLRSSTNTPLTLLLASATAVFDASQMGSVTYLLDESLIATNSFIVTNGVLTLTNGQSISGLGTIRGSVVAPAGTTLNPGNVTGVLTNGIGTGVLEVTNSLSVAGAVNIRINQTNAVPADKLVANSFVIDPAATLLVTNVGTTILDGTTFTLFSQGVSFTSVTLPPSPYVWQNDLAANGTIKLISGGIPPVDPTPTNITFSMTGNQITLSWPVSHKGWDLQTNVDVGNSASWGTVAGSAATNQVIITIDPSIGHLFYRMHYLAP